MKFSASAILAAAAIGGVAAHPSGHAHAHLHRREPQEFVKAGKPTTTTVVQTVYTKVAAKTKPTSTSVAAVIPTTEVVPEVSSTTLSTSTTTSASAEPSNTDDSDSGSDDEGEGVSSVVDFCSGSSSKRATVEQIAYKGNTGTSSDYGCNYMLAKSSIAKEYKYSVKVVNSASKAQKCVAYNKIGADGGINGFWSGNEALSFDLPASGTQWVVVDGNTQGGIICGVGSIPTTSYGEYASTWAEFDFGNESNDGWSGADASCLVAAAEGLDIPGMKIDCDGTESIIYPGGTGKNAYLGGMEAEDGVGCNIAAGKTSITVWVGYQG